LILPVIGLPRGLKLALEIGGILREGGGDVAGLVAINGAFLESVLSRNSPQRLSRYEPVVNGDTRWMGANAANSQHRRASTTIDTRKTRHTTRKWRRIRA
jgi:hypothetical protein